MTVLSETTRYIITNISAIVLCVGIVLGLLIAAIGATYDSMRLAIVGAVIAFAAMIFTYVYLRKPYLEIKAVISDSYSATELYDKYDVIKRDGKIWILNERK